MVFDTFTFIRTPLMNLKVSHKVQKLCVGLLNEMIWEPYRISDHYPATLTNMDVALTIGDLVLEELEVYGPNIKTELNMIDFVLWLPYNRLSEYDNHLKPFLKYYFDGMVQVFSHYAVPETAIREVQALVEKEVIDNPDYVYVNLYPWHDDFTRLMYEKYPSNKT